MFRGTTARTVLVLLGVTLLTLQLFTPTGTFAPAHAFDRTPVKTETGIASLVQAPRDGTETVRTPGRPDRPVGLPHVRDRHRGPASHGAQDKPLIPGPAGIPGAAHRHAPGPSRAHTPAALQVFRC
ncbi:hypothetical protein GT039_24550 [Streptomyces sp. SID2955]|nr:hypothetical protein [Streptomyces sp. SID2955]